MQKKKTAVPTYLGVAAVWIGSHFGPGFATGAFSVRWYVKYGWVGLVTPLLAMLITGGVMYFMLEYAREHGTPNYRPFARSCYGEKLGGVVAVILTAHDQQPSGRRNPLLGLLNIIARVYVTVIRGTPMMVQLLIMGMVIFASSRNFTAVGVLTLGINSGAYVSEIIRGGLMSIDPGQMEAGRSLGLGYITTMRVIVVPQAIKAVLPALGNEFIVLLKDTSLITVIGGKELLYAARGIMNRTYEQMFPLLGTAAIYLVLVMIFTWLLGILERRLRQGDRR